MRFEIKIFSKVVSANETPSNKTKYAIWDNHYNSWYHVKEKPLKILNTKDEALKYLHKVQKFESCGIIKAANIQWDITDSYDLQFLPTEIMIPSEVLNKAKTNKNAISDYITNVSKYHHKGFDLVECEVFA